MAVNNDLRKALMTWKNSELTEVNEAPAIFRVLGLVLVSVTTVFAIFS